MEQYLAAMPIESRRYRGQALPVRERPSARWALRSRASKPSGTINNTKPWTIGGKSSCSSSTVTCDYFAGDIDYVKLTKGWRVELPEDGHGSNQRSPWKSLTSR